MANGSSKPGSGELRTESLFQRPSIVHANQLGVPLHSSASVAELLGSLPKILAGDEFRKWRDALCRARRNKRPVVAAIGGHVIKAGCGPYLIDWLNRGVLTAVAMNGAAAIHDIELALAGHTSEHVESRLLEGRFGTAREPAELFARAASQAACSDRGLGEMLGSQLLDVKCSHPQTSVLRAAFQRGVSCTVHVSLGADVVHMHAAVSGADLGAASMIDFRRLCAIVCDLEGGVWMNLGSAVILPEVFLKAVAIARNKGHDMSTMTTVDLDMIRSYRARVNVLQRHRCKSIAITGHHEIILPLLHAAVAAELANCAELLHESHLNTPLRGGVENEC